jgi:hypothetical protein
VRLAYEKGELRRDICFLENGSESLVELLRQQHDKRRLLPGEWLNGAEIPSFESSISRATTVMYAALAGSHKFQNFITDRDGTVNNYCDRYSSSVQSAYNAFWLGQFAQTCVVNSVVLTAAPLGGRPGTQGLVELCTMPEGVVTYAGSKGREYFDPVEQLVLDVEPLPMAVAALLEKLYSRLFTLCTKPANVKFLGLGSGLQRKYGEITMARNDPGKSVSDAESCRFMRDVLRLKDELDPHGNLLDMHDTGTDMEIFSRMPAGGSSFNKGTGVRGLDQKLSLGVTHGPNLVCGDTASDVPMIEAALSLMSRTSESASAKGFGERLAVLFVITPEQDRKTPELAEKVQKICSHGGVSCAILPSPDVLVAALHRFTEETLGAHRNASSVKRSN